MAAIEPDPERAGTGEAARATRRATITGCVIVRNEEGRLPRCLDSLRFCDEVIVVDSGSTDATIDVARVRGATVVENAWPGFGAQRNVALDHARGDWLIEVDADEWLSPELAAEIEAFLAEERPAYSIAVLPMRQHFLGGELGPSAHYPFHRVRMFRRGEYRHDEDRTVHEGLAARTRPWVFTADMNHELAGTWGEALADSWTYARLEAHQLGRTSLKTCLVGLTARPAAKFIYQLALLGGWRDGWRGVVKVGLECATDAMVLVRYALGRRRSPAPPPAPTGDRPGVAAGPTAGGHFGRSARRVGPIRLAAVGGRRAVACETTHRWLAEAQAAGAWVTLISSASGQAPEGVRVHRLNRLGPVSLMRALDAERQLGPLDGVVGLDRWSWAVLHLVPAAVRSHSSVTEASQAPAPLVAHLRALTRGKAD